MHTHTQHTQPVYSHGRALKSKDTLLSGVRGRCDYGRIEGCYTADSEDSRRGAMSWGVWVDSEKWKRQQNRFSLGAFGEKHSPADSLILVRGECRISNLQKLSTLWPSGFLIISSFLLPCLTELKFIFRLSSINPLLALKFLMWFYSISHIILDWPLKFPSGFS